MIHHSAEYTLYGIWRHIHPTLGGYGFTGWSTKCTFYS